MANGQTEPLYVIMTRRFVFNERIKQTMAENSKKVRVAIIGIGNCASSLIQGVQYLNVPVHRGMTHDGLGKYVRTRVEKAEGPTDNIVKILKETEMEGRAFGNVPLNLELKLEVWDSPNSAGVMIDAVRCAKIGLDRGLGGPLLAPSAYFMKTPPQQFTDGQARDKVEAFITGRE
jgi:myo-inositol-1-phosphate synthase